jgi:hypothetical protein
VVPLGPNGVPAVNTVSYPLLLDNKDPNAERIFYNYTLYLQGLTSNINCLYDIQSPITFSSVSGDGPAVYQYNGTCSGRGQDVLVNASFITLAGASHLGFWACKTSSPGGNDQYLLYLSGRGFYQSAIGNITCTVSPIQPAIFPVKYESRPGTFYSLKPTITFTNTSTELIRRAIKGIGAVILESQNKDSNLVAESVITFGVKSLGLQPYTQDASYLKLYGALFQGIIEYEVCSDAPLHIPIPQYPAIGDIHPLDIYTIYQSSSFLLQPHREWVCNLFGNWVVCKPQEYLFLAADDVHQSGCLDPCDRGCVHGRQGSVRF